MNTSRAFLWLAIAAPASLVGGAATAQVDDAIVLNIMRECSRIDDATARLACYDNNIRAAGSSARSSVPGAMPAPQGGRGAVASNVPQTTPNASGFGNESIRAPQRMASPAGDQASLTSTVTAVAPREPGVYLLTLQDGAQWQFTEGVDRTYRVPSRGDAVTIDRASLGSFLMRYDDQMGIRVRRVR